MSKTITGPALRQIMGRGYASMWRYVQAGKLPKPRHVISRTGWVNEYDLKKVIAACKKHKLVDSLTIALLEQDVKG